MNLGQSLFFSAFLQLDAFSLLYTHSTSQKILILLVPQGHMALTNYLMQTLLGIFTFSQVGFGFQSLGPAAWTLFALAVFTGQVILSTIWIKYFQYGPMEWIWRQLTYGKRLPLKKKHTVREVIKVLTHETTTANT